MSLFSHNSETIENCINALYSKENTIIEAKFEFNQTPDNFGTHQYDDLIEFYGFISKIGDEFVDVEFKILERKMNPILEDILKNKFNYVHALEINSVDELKTIIDGLFDEFIDKYSLKDIMEFFNSMELYCLDENNQADIDKFSCGLYIKNELS